MVVGDSIPDNEDSDYEQYDRGILDDPITELPAQLQPETPEETEAFLNSPCCAKNCIKNFDKQILKDSHEQARDTSEYCSSHVNHQHILLLGALNALTRTSDKIQSTNKPTKDRARFRTDFQFRGQPVCEKLFRFVFGCGIRMLKNVKKNFAEAGMELQQHKNVRKSSLVRAIPFEIRKDAVNFVNNFALQHALVLPGRVPATRNLDLKLLPSTMTKKYVYDEYKAACNEIQATHMKRSSWYATWNTLCPYIAIQKPRSDLCPECQRNVISLGSMQGLEDYDKEIRIETSRSHLERVKSERLAYKNGVMESIELLKTVIAPAIGRNIPCSFDGTIHYSFDYAQQIHLPYSSQQVGPLYFLTGYKVGLFGVAIEPLGKFILYIIPESCVTGKGSNVVISLLHHFFENFALGETRAHCHADNCSGQNKNNYLMQYFLWRIANNLHKDINISFLPVGHTKFAPDLYFGLFKKSFRKQDSNCLSDLVNVCRLACPTSKAITCCMVGDEAGTIFVPTYDWQTLLSSYKPARIPHLLKYFHCFMDSTTKGRIRCKKFEHEDTQSYTVFTNTNVITGMLPALVPIPGLNNDRKKYLYHKIREYVKGEEAKNKLCPNPNVEADENQQNGDESDIKEHLDSIINTVEQDPALLTAPTTSVASSSSAQSISAPHPVVPLGTADTAPRLKRKNVCGYCKQEGHRNLIIRGKIYCPKRANDEPGGINPSQSQ